MREACQDKVILSVGRCQHSSVIEYALMVACEGPRHIEAWMHNVAAYLWDKHSGI